MKRTFDRVRPNKRFGQHFLSDLNILHKIVRAAEVRPGDVVLEIGPGLGHLTRALLDAGARVVAVELDRNLAELLRTDLQGYAGLSILQGDFLEAGPDEWLARAGVALGAYRVVANLPYYITSPILRRLLETSQPPAVIVVLVQREVARQITAKPGEMSLLALGVQFYGQPRVVSLVPAGAFFPRPQVDSAIVRIEVPAQPRFPRVDPSRFFEIAQAGFGARRKQLRNSLSAGLNASPEEVASRLARAGIDPRHRAETLSLEDWLQVYEQFR